MGKSLASSAPIVKSFANYLQLQRRKSLRTVERYSEILNAFFAFLGEPKAPTQAIQEDSLRAYCRSLKKLSPATQAQAVSALKTFLRWAENEKLVPAHLDRFLVRPKVPKKVIRIVEEEDLSLLVKTLETRPKPEKLLFELLYGSGLRISEAAQIQFKDYSARQGLLCVHGKGKKERSVPLTHRACELLQENDILDNWPRKAKALRAWVKIWQKLCPLEGESLHPHKLRHSIASHLLRRGAKLPHIQKLLGHERLGTTERYTHLNTEDLVKAYDKAFPKLKKD